MWDFKDFIAFMGRRRPSEESVIEGLIKHTQDLSGQDGGRTIFPSLRFDFDVATDCVLRAEHRSALTDWTLVFDPHRDAMMGVPVAGRLCRVLKLIHYSPRISLTNAIAFTSTCPF